MICNNNEFLTYAELLFLNDNIYFSKVHIFNKFKDNFFVKFLTKNLLLEKLIIWGGREITLSNILLLKNI
jgi:hypothetical protein